MTSCSRVRVGQVPAENQSRRLNNRQVVNQSADSAKAPSGLGIGETRLKSKEEKELVSAERPD